MLNMIITNKRDRALVAAVALGAALAVPSVAAARITPHPIANSHLHACPIANSKVRF